MLTYLWSGMLDNVRFRLPDGRVVTRGRLLRAGAGCAEFSAVAKVCRTLASRVVHHLSPLLGEAGTGIEDQCQGKRCYVDRARQRWFWSLLRLPGVKMLGRRPLTTGVPSWVTSDMRPTPRWACCNAFSTRELPAQ